MPMMFMFLKHKKASKAVYKTSVILTYIFIFIIFFSFMNSVSLLSGNSTSVDTFSGLMPFMGRNILVMGALIGLLAVVTSYIVFVDYYKNMLRCDVNCNRIVSIAISMFLPLLFLLLDIKKLDDLMSLVGGVMGGIIAVVVLLIYQRVRNKNTRNAPYNLNLPNWLLVIIGSFCFVGAIFQIILRMLNLK
jgi:membrane-associated HD superfamily phosphohydrolase